MSYTRSTPQAVPLDVEVMTDSTTYYNIADSLRDGLKFNDGIYPDEMASMVEDITKSKYKGINFTSRNEFVTLKMKGCGPVRLYVNNLLISQVELSEDATDVTLSRSDSKYTVYQIDQIENLTELDVSDSGIESFEITSFTNLQKLVIHTNHICELDCSNCKNLQFLHFHNNPICDDSKYESNLGSCIQQLPDRSDTSIGSIIMYPWYGLEKLICKKEDGVTYAKYPYCKWKDIDGSDRNSYSGKLQLKFEEGRLYGVVEDSSISYYRYISGKLVEFADMNRHHALRKELELSTTLAKNWMFGSAIQYDEEYKYCHYYFRDLGIQHVWETAEKGFGIRIGSIDQFPGQALGWNDMNILAGLYHDGSDIVPYKKSDWAHGDFILSQIVGRGNNISYGICPNATILTCDVKPNNSSTIVVQDYWEGHIEWRNGIKRIVDNCDTYTSSYTAGYCKLNEGTIFTEEHQEVVDTFSDVRRLLGLFGKDNVVTIANANDGDGLPWTFDRHAPDSSNNTDYMTYGYGDYNSTGESNIPDSHTNCFFVAALTPLRKASTFSISTNDAGVSEMLYVGDMVDGVPSSAPCSRRRPTVDTLASYGEQILGYSNSSKNIACYQGTSMATPNCNATLALMRIIYSKMHPECTSFGKGSKFMEYVIAHWIDPIEGQMDFSVGLGIPCFTATPQKIVPATIPSEVGVLVPGTYEVGKSFKVERYGFANCKKGSSFGDYDTKKSSGSVLRNVAILSPTELVPIRPVNHTMRAYSNCSLTNPSKFEENYEISSFTIDNVVDCEDIRVIEEGRVTDIISSHIRISDSVREALVFSPDSSAKEYTAQIVIQFLPEKFTDIVDNVAATYEINPILVKFVSPVNELANILRINKVTFTIDSDGKRTFNIGSALLGIAKYTSQLGTVSCTVASNKLFKPVEGDIAVITVTYHDEYLYVYYNGTLLNKLHKGMADYNDFSKCYIHAKPLMSETDEDSLSDVLFYDRVLSHEEIIHNTIALLKEKEGR